MARIAGVDIPNDKRVVISLTYIYGIGLTTSKKVLEEAGISEDVRVKDLTEEQLNAIRNNRCNQSRRRLKKRSTIKHQEIDGNWMLQRNASQKRIASTWTKNKDKRKNT